MSKLTKDTTRTYELGDINELPVLGGETIYQGASVGLESNGYVRSLQATDKFIGFAENHIDASNAVDGEKSVRVKKRGSILLDLAGVSLSDVGKNIYALDDNTFTLSDSNSCYIGQISRYEFDERVIVDFDANR